MTHDIYGHSNLRDVYERVAEMQRQFHFQDEMLEWNAQRSLGRRIAEHEERQARGAWRAGYDYLFKSWPNGSPFDVTFTPSNDPEHLTNSLDTVVVRWNIHEIDDAEALEVLGRDD